MKYGNAPQRRLVSPPPPELRLARHGNASPGRSTGATLRAMPRWDISRRSPRRRMPYTGARNARARAGAGAGTLCSAAAVEPLSRHRDLTSLVAEEQMGVSVGLQQQQQGESVKANKQLGTRLKRWFIPTSLPTLKPLGVTALPDPPSEFPPSR